MTDAIGTWFLANPQQDTLTGHFIDSVVVKPALPDPLVPIVQWIFQKPSWVMISGIVVAAILGVALVLLVWRRHTAIARWLGARNMVKKSEVQPGADSAGFQTG